MAEKFSSVFQRITVVEGDIIIDATGLKGAEKLHREGHRPEQRYIRIPGKPGMQVGLKQADKKALKVVAVTLPTEGWSSYGTVRIETQDSKGTPCEVYFRCRAERQATEA